MEPADQTIPKAQASWLTSNKTIAVLIVLVLVTILVVVGLVVVTAIHRNTAEPAATGATSLPITTTSTNSQDSSSVTSVPSSASSSTTTETAETISLLSQTIRFISDAPHIQPSMQWDVQFYIPTEAEISITDTTPGTSRTYEKLSVSYRGTTLSITGALDLVGSSVTSPLKTILNSALSDSPIYRLQQMDNVYTYVSSSADISQSTTGYWAMSGLLPASLYVSCDVDSASLEAISFCDDIIETMSVVKTNL